MQTRIGKDATCTNKISVDCGKSEGWSHNHRSHSREEQPGEFYDESSSGSCEVDFSEPIRIQVWPQEPTSETGSIRKWLITCVSLRIYMSKDSLEMQAPLHLHFHLSLPRARRSVKMYTTNQQVMHEMHREFHTAIELQLWLA